MTRGRGALVAIAVAAALAAGAGPAGAAGLTAGVGRADVTPPTGYFALGWVRSDALLTGQHTRLFARAIVLERDGRKVALVAIDLGAVSGGQVVDAAESLRDRGFSERNVLVSASHTHAGPTGYFNHGAYNTVFMTAEQPTTFNTDPDPQLYGFMVRQLATAIRRADDNRSRAAAAWGTRRLTTLTRNRSVEAHLANHGIHHEHGQGSAVEDPLGAVHTIDPEVRVLRVDKVGRRGRRIPLGIWSTFANHGTVNAFTFHYYNADHHGSATRVLEERIRREGRVPRRQDVVNAYGNTDEGDQSSGLHRRGPAQADYTGRVEAREMLRAWRQAGRRLSREPALDARWTRVCFCGQSTEGGSVDDRAVIGQPLFTGSEEGRGPLFDVTHEHYEGRRLPASVGPQGRKVQTLTTSDVPKAVPLLAVRVGDTMIASIPGEMTAGMGERVRAAVLDASRAGGVTSAVISGVANEYLQYFTTPEEYEMQHYEGGSTLYGVLSSNILKLTLIDLARALVEGREAPAAYDYDVRQGLQADETPYSAGADRGAAGRQPVRTERLSQAVFGWQGGQRGFDRPLDRPFVRIQRRLKGRWRPAADDLGLQILWEVDDEGNYRAAWEVPFDAPLGRYRFLVTANRYRLASRSFRVIRSAALRLIDAGGGRLVLEYPAAAPERDILHRPSRVRSAVVTYVVDGERVAQRGRDALNVPPGDLVVIRRGAARDRHGNYNANTVRLRR